MRYGVGGGCRVVGNGIRLMAGMGLLEDMGDGDGICDGDGNDGVLVVAMIPQLWVTAPSDKQFSQVLTCQSR